MKKEGSTKRRKKMGRRRKRVIFLLCPLLFLISFSFTSISSSLYSSSVCFLYLSALIFYLSQAILKNPSCCMCVCFQNFSCKGLEDPRVCQTRVDIGLHFAIKLELLFLALCENSTHPTSVSMQLSTFTQHLRIATCSSITFPSPPTIR